MQCYSSAKQAANVLSSSVNGRRLWDDSFWICDLSETAALLKQWSERMPRIRPYYAMKAGPHPPLIRFLLLQGAGVDCASQKEIDMALEMGANPDDIVYSNPNKQTSHLLYAKDENINVTVYDSEEELRKIHSHHSKARVLIRLQARHERAEGSLNDRFGATLSRARHLIELSKELGVDTVGISFHVGSPCLDESNYSYAIKHCRELFDFAESIGMKFEMLDLGGGFDGRACMLDSLEKIFRTINDALDKYFSKDRFPGLDVIAEPGRYFCESSFSLVTNVIAKRESADVIEYTLNEGRCLSLLSPAIDEEFDTFEPYSLLENLDEEKQLSRLYGPTCIGFDVIKEKTFLPNLGIGEWLIWPEIGAYTFATTTYFGGWGTEIFYNITTESNNKQLDSGYLQSLKDVCRDSVTIVANRYKNP